ncbi:HAMP domain-containing protein, partial [candidate division GN15 bacterium]|nr:HAMP domain-containing protein [candidate division GN15 bacterium]
MFAWNIRNQILATGLLSLVVFIAAVGYFYSFSRDQFSENSNSLVAVTGQRYADRVSRTLANQSATFSDWTADDVYGIALEFNTTSELQRDFKERLAGESGFALLALVNKQGTVAALATAEGYGDSQARVGQRLAELGALDEGRSCQVTFVECPSLNANDDRTFAFYCPSFGTDGSRNGALIALADWRMVAEDVTAFYEEFAGRDYAGAWSVLSQPQSGVAAATEGGQSYASYVDDLIATGAGSSGEMITTAEIGNTGMIVGATPVTPPTISGQQDVSAEPLQLLMAIPESDVMAKLNSSLAIILILGLIGAGLVMAISYWVARRISGRITRVTVIASDMAKGHIDQKIDSSSSDEVGALARAFNELGGYMKEMASAAEKIAEGDLRVRVEPRSEQDVLGKSFKAMIQNLSELIGKVTESAQGLVRASGEIASTSEQMSRGATDQSDQVSQISTAVEEMTANVIENSKHAGDAREYAEKAASTASDGGDVVSNTIQGMQKIADVVRNSAQSISDLAKSADQIGEITLVIDEIADQTNLLALNAAIEAARAGEQGRGFAVVADEVRKLAERTGSATSEITAMIKEIQTKTEEAVESME